MSLLSPGEEQVAMLSYQHNSIRAISRLEQLPQLTILDMYSNNIQSLQGLPRTPGLRGLMLGRNYISSIDSQQASCTAVHDLLGFHSARHLRHVGVDGIKSLCTCLKQAVQHCINTWGNGVQGGQTDTVSQGSSSMSTD